MSSFLSRILVAIVGLPVVLGLVWVGGWWLFTLVAVGGVVAVHEFVTMARMKGLPERSIMLRHAARNALLPLVTAFALGFGASVGGNVVIETVFSWPGLGRLLVDAVAGSDYPLAQGAFLMIAAVLVLMNLVADLLYSWLDPRVSHAG